MSLSELVEVQDGRASIEITPAVSRMFTWDTTDEVHGEVVDAGGGRLYGDLPEALPRPAVAAGGDGEAWSAPGPATRSGYAWPKHCASATGWSASC
ncbi:hypothetical protein G6F60_015077 [Rhizopus arrhizus]|nr:hypothetical protein G6F60_015077 [Rhizopus arrhizus]